MPAPTAEAAGGFARRLLSNFPTLLSFLPFVTQLNYFVSVVNEVAVPLLTCNSNLRSTRSLIYLIVVVFSTTGFKVSGKSTSSSVPETSYSSSEDEDFFDAEDTPGSG